MWQAGGQVRLLVSSFLYDYNGEYPFHHIRSTSLSATEFVFFFIAFLAALVSLLPGPSLCVLQHCHQRHRHRLLHPHHLHSVFRSHLDFLREAGLCEICKFCNQNVSPLEFCLS